MRLRESAKVEIPFCIVEKEAALSTTTSLTRIPRQSSRFFNFLFFPREKAKKFSGKRGEV